MDYTVALECFKKQSSRTQSPRAAPFRSERLLRVIKDKGGLRACLKYLEYLTMDCKIDDEVIHTELACLYVQYIVSYLRQYAPVPHEESSSAHAPEEVSSSSLLSLDVARADQDPNIFGKLILITSSYYK